MALPPDYMSPEMYMGFYRTMVLTLEDGSVVQVDIRKYLNHGKVVLPKPGQPKKQMGVMEQRATAANAEYWSLMSRVGADPLLNSPSGTARRLDALHVPLRFELEGSVYNKAGIKRAFMGKGSSLEIAHACILASRYDRTVTTETYCDRYLGLDCSGFVSNYWGYASAENIDHKNFDVRRRKDLTSLTIGDAVVYFKGPESPKHKSTRSVHIAVVNEVQSMSTSGSETTLVMNLVESAGEEEGLHKTETKSFTLKRNHEGEYYYYSDRSGRTGYICAGPPRNRPNGF